MKFSECHLRLEHKESNGDIILKFTTEHLGIRKYLCTIRKNVGMPLIQHVSNVYPDVVTRTSFRIIYGVKDYIHDYAVIGDEDQEDHIAFFRCRDRSGNNRILTCASEQPGRDAGGIFFTPLEDYEEITRMLLNIDLHTLGEQDAT